MQVVVAVIAPAVEVRVRLLHAAGCESLDLFRAGVERGEIVVVCRIVRFVVVRVGGNVGGDAFVNDRTSEELFHVRVAGDFFTEGNQAAALLDVGTVGLREIVVIAVFHEAVQHPAGICHVAEGRDPQRCDLFAAVFVTEFIAHVKRGVVDRQITGSSANLAVDRHIAVAFHDLTAGNPDLRTCRNKSSLHTGENGVGFRKVGGGVVGLVAVRGAEIERCGEADAVDFALVIPFHEKGEVYVVGDRFDFRLGADGDSVAAEVRVNGGDAFGGTGSAGAFGFRSREGNDGSVREPDIRAFGHRPHLSGDFHGVGTHGRIAGEGDAAAFDEVVCHYSFLLCGGMK